MIYKYFDKVTNQDYQSLMKKLESMTFESYDDFNHELENFKNKFFKVKCSIP